MADKLVTLQDENKTPIYPESRASVVKTSDGKTVEDALAEKQPVGDYALKSEIPDTSGLATKDELSAKADTTAIPTNVSQLTNDKGYLTDAPSDGNQYGRKDGAWAVIEAGGTQYLDLSMFSSESGTLSDEDYQKVVKAYEDGVNMLLYDYLGYKLPVAGIVSYTDGYGIIYAFSYWYMNNILIVTSTVQINSDKTYIKNEVQTTIYLNGDGTQCLTDNGQYSDFAKPTKVESGGSGSVTKQLSPNTLYKFGECSSLTVTLGAETSGIVNEYMFEFVSGSTATTLSVPDSVTWSGGEAPTIEANKTYQVSIVNNLAVYAAF